MLKAETLKSASAGARQDARRRVAVAVKFTLALILGFATVNAFALPGGSALFNWADKSQAETENNEVQCGIENTGCAVAQKGGSLSALHFLFGDKRHEKIEANNGVAIAGHGDGESGHRANSGGVAEISGTRADGKFCPGKRSARGGDAGGFRQASSLGANDAAVSKQLTYGHSNIANYPGNLPARYLHAFPDCPAGQCGDGCQNPDPRQRPALGIRGDSGSLPQSPIGVRQPATRQGENAFGRGIRNIRVALREVGSGTKQVRRDGAGEITGHSTPETSFNVAIRELYQSGDIRLATPSIWNLPETPTSGIGCCQGRIARPGLEVGDVRAAACCTTAPPFEFIPAFARKGGVGLFAAQAEVLHA